MKMILKRTLRTVAWTMLCVYVANAQGPVFSMAMDLGPSFIKPEKAKVEGIGDVAWLLRVGGSATFADLFRITGGLGVWFLRDDAEFSQSTTGGQKSSATGGLNLYIQGGFVPSIDLGGDPNDRTFEKITFGLGAGLNSINATRHIPDCIDCREDDLNLSSGFYVQPSIFLVLSGGTGIGLSYDKYLSGSDFKDEFLLSLTVTFTAE